MLPAFASGTEALETVVLVHGTFSGRDSDQGSGWWQLGSECTNALRECLPAGVQLPREGELFHWSGENSERARIKAAGDLLDHLRQLDAQGTGYHLVGHSHGGSVIWHALRMSVLKKKPLQGLKSWATVGTPFLHLRTESGSNYLNWINLALAIVLIKPALQTFTSLMGFFLATDKGSWLQTHLWRHSEEIHFWQSPVLWTVRRLGESVTVTESGTRIGNLTAAEEDSVVALLSRPEGWVLLGAVLLVIYVFLNLAGFFISPVLESMRLRSEHRLEEKTFALYGKRWLGLWSPDDEAINGLRATIDMSISFVSRMMVREPVLLSDYMMLLSRPYHWVVTPLFNLGVRPLLDRIVRKLVIKRAQGNNRPAAAVVRVAPVPLFSAKDDAILPLPEALNRTIVDRANDHAGNAAAQLRRLLTSPSLTKGLEELGSQLSGRELVHTSYFDHPEIIDLLTMHIAWARGSADWHRHASKAGPELWSWLQQAKEQVGGKLALLNYQVADTDTSAMRTLAIKPRRAQGRKAA